MTAALDRSDWIVLALAAAPKAYLSPVQLQKSLFLLDQNLSDAQRETAGFYQFTAYDYGPFDSDVYFDADRLEEAGTVAITSPGGRGSRKYGLTPQGSAHAQLVLARLKPDVRMYLQAIVAWVCSLSFDDLVRAIYKAYPGMKVNSVFKD